MRRTAIVILVFLSAVSLSARQAVTGATSPTPQNPQDARPPRDPRKPNEAGTARIRGRVIGGEAGTPLRRATVSVHGEGYDTPRAALTDENGRYELKEVPPGRVQITASKGGYIEVVYGQRRPQQTGRPVDLAAGQTVDIDFNLPRGGAISGRITDDIGEPAVGASVTAQHWRYADGKRQLLGVNGAVTDDFGRFRIFGLPAGDYYVSATLEGAAFAVSASRTGTCKTFYPGTANQSEAQRLHVTAGGETSSANFAVLPTHTVQLSGSVIDSGGRPAGLGFITLIQTDGSTGQFTSGGMIKPDGTFLVTGLNPGDYQLFVQLGFGTEDGESAFMPLDIGSEDLTGITITTVGPSMVSGQVIFDGPTPSSITPGQFMFGARPPTRTFEMGRQNGPITVRNDWTFETRLTVSPALIVGGDISQKWTLKAVLQGGVDVTDTGIQFKPGEPVDNVQLVVTDRTTTLTGSVTNERGAPAAGCTIVIYPEDAALWVQDWRYLKTEQSDEQGRFSVKGLPPGRYLAIAAADLEDGQSSDREFLEQSRDRATPFVLGDGERKTLPLTFKQ